jgi:hypothetical protein
MQAPTSSLPSFEARRRRAEHLRMRLPESITTNLHASVSEPHHTVIMDSGLATSWRPGMTNHQNSHKPSEPLREPMGSSARTGLHSFSNFAHCSGGIASLRSQ